MSYLLFEQRLINNLIYSDFHDKFPLLIKIPIARASGITHSLLIILDLFK
jgi:hypothetical protein